MCETCGCSDPIMAGALGAREHHDGHGHKHSHEHRPETRQISLAADLREKNNRIAAVTRQMLQSRGIVTVNLLSSPGAGKTTLLEHTLRRLKGEIGFAVVEGDQQTDNDAVRIRACGVPVQQINTVHACHLNAEQVAGALNQLPLHEVRVLFIENVGNLVCPASFDLGEDFKITLLSTTEGHDKPQKYPLAFHLAKAMILTKTDLLPYVSFDPNVAIEHATRLNPNIQVIHTACHEGHEQMDGWLEFVRGLVSRVSAGSAHATPTAFVGQG